MPDEKLKEIYERQLQTLNNQCVQCQAQNGIPNPDHCDYHCTIGLQIHKLYCMMGEANHSNWGR